MNFERINFKYNPDFPDCVTITETNYDNLAVRQVILSKFEILKLVDFAQQNGVIEYPKNEIDWG